MILKVICFIVISLAIFIYFPIAGERKKNKTIKGIYKQLKKGVSVNTKNFKGDSFIHQAIWYKDFELFTYLIDKGADISLRDKGGRTPLIYAALFDYSDMVRLLLEKGADPNEKDFSDDTSLHWIAMNGGYESACLLIEYGANINPVNDRGDVPLNQATGFTRPRIISLLVKNGADPNIEVGRKNSLLNLVAGEGDTEAVIILIEKGALNSVDGLNACMSHLARDETRKEDLTFISDYAAKYYGQSEKLDFPLYSAAIRMRDVETVGSLIKNGADAKKAISEINKEYGLKIKHPKSSDPIKIAKKIVIPLKRALERKERKEKFENFVNYKLGKYFFIGIHVLFILVPTLYLCFTASWAFFLIPGIPFGLLGLMVYQASSRVSPSGDIQGMGIVVIILGLDVFLMLLMTVIVIIKFRTG